MIYHQKGIGLVEVMAALVILAIGILGFTAMQLRATNSSIEAGNNVQAINLARDLAERMRVNREGLKSIQTGNYSNPPNVECGVGFCTAETMAQYDFGQVKQRATRNGMQIAVLNCPGSTLERSCVYVSWDETNPTNGSGDNDCTNGTSYRAGATCLIMEIYNHG